MTATATDAAVAAADSPLKRNRDFRLLWVGQTFSTLGASMASVSLPLLVLGLTGSPAKVGLVAAVGMLPLVVFGLPAGVLVDRWDRRRAMLATDGARLLATLSVPIALWLGHLWFGHILVVAFTLGTGWVVFWICENAALPTMVPAAQLSQAVALNQARGYGASLAGPPLGGALFSVARTLPFVADAVSYCVSLATVLLIRTPLQERRPAQPGHPVKEASEGLLWLWRQPLLRTVTLISAGSDFVLNALYLVLLITAVRQGATPTMVGVMFAIMGLSGLLGSLVAARLAARLSLRAVVIGIQCLTAVLVPSLALAPNAYVLGVIYGATMALWPLWNAAVGAYRMIITPAALQGRVQSVKMLISNGPVPLCRMFAGLLLASFSSTTTLLILGAILLLPATCAVVSPTVRRARQPAASLGQATCEGALA
ncbi:MAG: MFS transporter [Conexibacter sp.]